jgi:cell shape-determining protein MreC
MISRQQSSSKRKIISIIVGGGIAILLLKTPFVFTGSALAPLDSFIAASERVAVRAVSWLGIPWNDLVAIRTERDEALRTRDELNAELSSLKARFSDIETLDALYKKHKDERIIASVLSAPDDTPYDTLVVDAGSSKGVVQGAVVFSETNAPLGNVVKVHTTTAVVALFSSPGIVSTVYAPREKILAKATGMGGGVFTVLMPHGSDVREGDVFTMPTLKGEPLGSVLRVWSDPAEPGVIASLGYPHALRSLHFVSIEREPFEMPSVQDIRDAMTRFASTTEEMFAVPSELASTTASSTRPSP